MGRLQSVPGTVQSVSYTHLAGGGGVQQRNDVGIVVANCVQLVNPGVVGVVHVRLALVLSLIHILKGRDL